MSSPWGEKPSVCFGNLYMYGCLALTLLLCALAGFFLGTVWASVLLILPLSQAVKCLADFLVLRLTPPRRLPRLALERGVPPEGRTICVVSALLTDEAALADAARRLEEYRLANRDAGAELLFGLLADLPESRDDPAPRSRRFWSGARQCSGASTKNTAAFTFWSGRAAMTPWTRSTGAGSASAGLCWSSAA